MTAKYDIETLWTDIETLIKTNLAAKITSLNAEKNDSATILPLVTPAAGAYFNDLDETAAFFNPIILTMLSNVQSSPQGGATAKTVTVNVSVLLEDTGQDVHIWKRMLRYQRCFEEIVEDNFKANRGFGDLQVEHLPVVTFLMKDTSKRYKIAGIDIVSTIV